MTFDEFNEAMAEYSRRFGGLPDSRQMTDEDLDRLPDLVVAALRKGVPIDKDEIKIKVLPEDVVI